MKAKKSWIFSLVFLILSLLFLVPYINSYEFYLKDLQSWDPFLTALPGLKFMLINAVIFFALLWYLNQQKKQPLPLQDAISFSAIFGITAGSISLHFFPFMMGWDSSTHYFVTISEIALNNYYRIGINPYLIELFWGLLGKVIGTHYIPVLILLSGTLLLGYGLKKWNTVFHSKTKIWPLLWCILLLIPAINFQLNRDLKLDIIILGFSLIMLSFWKQKQYKKTALLLGLLPLMKLTLFWFWPGFLLTTLFLLRKKIFKRETVKHLVSIFLLLFLPILIWGSVNVYRSNIKIHPQNFVQIFFKGKSRAPGFHIPKSEIKNDIPTKGTDEFEIKRYSGLSLNPINKLKTIFLSENIHLSTKRYTDLGPFWILLIIISIYGQCRSWRSASSVTKSIYLTLWSGAIMWLYHGAGIIWYGFPFLIPLMLSGFILTRSKLPKTGYYALCSSIIILGLLSWIHFFYPGHPGLSKHWLYTPTEAGKRQILRWSMLYEVDISDILNTPEHLDSKILMSGTMLHGFIQNFDQRVLSTGLSDFLYRMVRRYEITSIKTQLKKQEFQWILFDKTISALELDPNGPLHQQHIVIYQFLSEHFDVAYERDRIVLFKVY